MRDGQMSEVRIDLRNQLLWRDGEPVKVGAKAFSLLRLLVENPDALLTKSQILDSVWGEISVSEGMVKEYVHDLRRALGDDPQRPRFIETVHGRGYRFLGGIKVLHADPELRRDFRGKSSIAVMPFTNISGNPGEEYFADGLTEELITALSFVPWLIVIARNSSFSYKGVSIDIRKVGRELGVQYLLEGAVRRAGNRLRVTGQLVDAATASHIWADRFETRLGNIFDVQDEITEAVVNAIGPQIQLAEIKRAVRRRPKNLSVYDLYLRARADLNNAQIAAAIGLLDKAVADAPDYSKAKAVRAWCTTLIGWRFVAPTDAQREAALQLAEEALGDPEADAETRAYAGYTIGFLSDQSSRAIGLLEDVTSQCPSFAWAWAALALLESYHGHAQRAIELAHVSLRLNPRDPQSFRSEMAIAKAYLTLNQYDASLKYADRGLQKNPGNAFFQICRISCLVRLGRLEDAQNEATRFKSENPDFTVSKWRALADYWRAWKSVVPIIEDALSTVGIPN